MGEILGLGRVEGMLSKKFEAIKDDIVDAVQATQASVVNDAKLLVRYKTGNLRRSIQPGEVILQGTEVSGVIYALMEYASDQEYGPKTGTKRRWAFTPYLRPALKRNGPRFIRALKRAIGQ